MDSGISPDTGNSDNSNEIEVPLNMLEIDGNPPGIGDTCDFAIEARVTSIDGDMAMVTPEKVNGQDVQQDAASSDAASPDSSEPQFDDSGSYTGA